MKWNKNNLIGIVVFVSLTFVMSLATGSTEKPLATLGVNGSQTKIDFTKTVLPILRQSCFPCHVSDSYIPMPSVSSDIARKIRREAAKAQGDFEMGTQFPFLNELTARKQLEHLAKELKERKMPPETQKKLGVGAPLSEADRKVLLGWVSEVKGSMH